MNPLLVLHTILGTTYFIYDLQNNLKQLSAIPYIFVSLLSYVQVVKLNIKYLKYKVIIHTPLPQIYDIRDDDSNEAR